MLKFKQFIEEVASLPAHLKNSGFIQPTGNTKFKLGDIVVVIPGSSIAHSAPKVVKHYDKAGTVIGYKPVQMASPKMAVEFPDNTIETFPASMLVGPFVSLEVASKYNRSNITNIDPRDVKGSSPLAESGQLEKNEKFEQALKDFFTKPPFNFKWLDTPVTIKHASVISTVLAIAPKANFELSKHIDQAFITELDWNSQNLINWMRNSDVDKKEIKKYESLLRDNFFIIRNNGVMTYKLQNYTHANDNIFHYNNGRNSSPYYMNFFKNSMSSHEMQELRSKPFNPAKVLLKYKSNTGIGSIGLKSVSLKAISNDLPYITKLLNAFSTDWSDQSLIDVLYNVKIEGGKRVIYAEDKQYLHRLNIDDYTAKYFKDTVVDMDVTYFYTGNTPVLPPKVRTLEIRTDDPNYQGNDGRYKGRPSNVTLTDFSFLNNVDIFGKKENYFMGDKELHFLGINIPKIENFPDKHKNVSFNSCGLKNLYGLPSEMDNLTVASNGLTTLEGSVEVVNGQFNFRTEENVKSLKGLPIAQEYWGPHHFKESDYEAAKKYAEKQRLIPKGTTGSMDQLMGIL